MIWPQESAMSALPDQGKFETAVDQPFFIVATLWRGAMVERFGRIEFFVNRSIESCASVGILPASRCAEHLPMKRMEVLLQSLTDSRLAAHSSPAISALTDVKEYWHQRNAICHGRMRVLKRSVRIDWTAFSKDRGSPTALRLKDTEMLESLAKMERAQTVLGSRLGMVDKICADLAARLS